MTTKKIPVAFTTEEEKILTALDAAAHDLMRVECRIKGDIPACWLVCSDETRAEYRKRVIDLAVANGGCLAFVVEPSRLFERAIPRHLIDAWRAAELSAKARREENDAHAFFAR
jgi:hypothetical protein